MTSPAIHRGSRKFFRTVAQLVAGGALTALVSAITGGLNPTAAAIIMGAWTAVVALAQNTAETAGRIPVFLPTPGIVPAANKVITPVVGTVEATAEKIGETVGEVAGTVESVAGDLIGEVVDVDRLGETED